MSAELRFTLADRLRKAREHAQLDQTDLAEQLEVTVRTIRNYERGHTMPTFTLAVRWAELTDCSLEWLAHGDVQPRAVA